MTLKINVSGLPVEIQADPTKLLRRAMNQAFAAAGLTGEPWENWELRDEAGRFLDHKIVLSAFGFESGATLFLNRKPGIGA